ncbi:MAG: hypothetical protein O3C63_01210 [Cyanobacteria bacterium]|nr:hypothetical protein [Cyanobacteriota bacterium]MDA1021101.1 hypothetical protein [Cyanobacteriota bacterium]
MLQNLPFIFLGLIIGIQVLQVIIALLKKRESVDLSISKAELINRLKEDSGENTASLSKVFLAGTKSSGNYIDLQLNHQIPKSILMQQSEQMPERVMELTGPVDKNNCHHVVDFLLFKSGLETPHNFDKWAFYTLLYDHRHSLIIEENNNVTHVKIYKKHNKEKAVSGLFMQLNRPGSLRKSIMNIDLKYTVFSNRLECKEYFFSHLIFLLIIVSFLSNISYEINAETKVWSVAFLLALVFLFFKYLMTLIQIHRYKQLLDKLVAKLI